VVTVLSFASIISELIDILFFKVTSSLLLLSRETKLTCLEFIGGHVVYYRKNIFLNKLNIQIYISQVSWKLIKISTKCLSTLLLRTRAQTFATANIGHQSSRQCNQAPTCISSRRRLLPYPATLHGYTSLSKARTESVFLRQSVSSRLWAAQVTRREPWNV